MKRAEVRNLAPSFFLILNFSIREFGKKKFSVLSLPRHLLIFYERYFFCIFYFVIYSEAVK